MLIFSKMSVLVKIGLILIVLHLVGGFVWLVIKLSPRKKENDHAKSIEEENSKTSED